MKSLAPLYIGLFMAAAILFMMFGLDNPLFQ